MKKILLTGLATGLMGLFMSSYASADTAAFNISGLDGGFNYWQSPGVIGNEFSVNSAIKVTQLGAYDSNVTASLPSSQSGYSYRGTETFQDTAVGLYDVTTHTLVASATVKGTDSLIGDFRYTTLTTPVSLNTTDNYAIVSQTGSNYYLVAANPNGTISSEIHWMGGAYGPNGATTLVEPTELSPVPNIFGNTNYDPNTFLGDFGGNFLYVPDNGTGPSPVPEPATMLLFGTGIVGLAAVGRRKKVE